MAGGKIIVHGEGRGFGNAPSRTSIAPKREKNKTNEDRHGKGGEVFQLHQRSPQAKMQERNGQIKVLPAGERFAPHWSRPHSASKLLSVVPPPISTHPICPTACQLLPSRKVTGALVSCRRFYGTGLSMEPSLCGFNHNGKHSLSEQC